MRSHLKPILTVLGVLLLAGPSPAQYRGFHPVFHPVFNPVFYPTPFPAFHHQAHWGSPGFPVFHPVPPRFPAGGFNHQFPSRGGVRPGVANVQQPKFGPHLQQTPAYASPAGAMALPRSKESPATRQREIDDLEKAADRLRRRADALDRCHEYNPHWREKRDDLQDQADKLDECRERFLDELRRKKKPEEKGEEER
jgi:hypothetical protein